MPKYILKKENLSLIEFEIQKNEFNESCIIIHWMDEKNPHLPEKVTHNVQSLNKWLKSRIIPRNRSFVHEILSSQGLNPNDMEGILNVSLGLSVNDPYWIVPEGSDGKFEDYNLYDNSFSEALSLVAFTGYSHTIKELSPSPEMTTNGMLPKAWRRINDKLYLYKRGTSIELFSNAGKEPYNEYYASQIAEKLGIEHVHYELEQWKGILASVCENFTDKKYSYVPIGKLLDEYTMSELKAKIEELNLMEKFKNMILLDALILNEDRHFGNFGVIKDNQTNKYIDLAPLFDHGISLFCYLSDKDMQNEEIMEQYKKDHAYSALGFAHEQLVSWFLERKDIEKLRKMINFRFIRHEKYNLSEERLKRIEDYLQKRIKELIHIIEYGISKKEADDSKEKILNLNSSFLGYSYQYAGDEYKGGRCLIMKDGYLVMELTVTEDDLKSMDPVTFIEDRIENILLESEDNDLELE